MEMRGSVEAVEACVGMHRADANELVNALLATYESTISSAPSGSRYQDCFDLETEQPCQEYIDLYG